jgi:predicted transcriptional regulator
MRQLTKSEEEIMQILWEIEEGYVRDVLKELIPNPAYNTVSTIIRILERKGFVSHKVVGKSHMYYPIVSKDEYTKAFMNGFVRNYFKNSWKELISFFNKNEDVSLEDLEEMQAMISAEIIKKTKK